jgi:hypothetical protein
MGKFLAVIGMLVVTSTGIAAACPTAAAKTSIPSLPPLMMGGAAGGAGQPYYCMASTNPTTLGDLSPSEWAKRVQICTTNCSYMPISPSDPKSTLVATSCGPGWHDTTYLVDPPRAPKTATLNVVDTRCNAMQPSKGAPPPPASPAPAASPAA